VTDIADGMALLEGRDRFIAGVKDSFEVPAHPVRVPSFFLDVREVTIGEYKAAFFGRLPEGLIGQTLRPADDDACAGTFIDDAIAHAERIGKRLPSEYEYEFAATLGGSRKFPWGDDAAIVREWTFGRAGEPEYDRLPTDPPVFGLFSNVAEWTSTRFAPYPPQLRLNPHLPTPSEGDFIGSHVVRGGDQGVTQRKPPMDATKGESWKEAGARIRFLRGFADAPLGVGFRCARSAKPRLAPDDFESALDDATAAPDSKAP
jgi:formylglycine-generating enzyme required for sulfatase activity